MVPHTISILYIFIIPDSRPVGLIIYAKLLRFFHARVPGTGGGDRPVYIINDR